MEATTTHPADDVFRELIRTAQAVQGLNRDLETALSQRDDAIVSAWRLGIGARTIAQVTDLTAARIAQIVEQAAAYDDAEVRRRQNRPLSRTVERMNAIPAAHMLKSQINPDNHYAVVVWTMGQTAPDQVWTVETLAAEMARHGWAPDPQLDRTLAELVDVRRQIWRVGPSRYRIAAPDDV